MDRIFNVHFQVLGLSMVTIFHSTDNGHEWWNLPREAINIRDCVFTDAYIVLVTRNNIMIMVAIPRIAGAVC